MSNKLYEIIAKTFQISESEINDESNPETIDSWDSFHALALFNTLEEEFSKDGDPLEIPDEDAEKITTVQSAVDYIQSKGIQD